MKDPTVTISTRTKNRLEKIQRVVRERDDKDQQRGFAPRPFILCSLPFKRPPRSQLTYRRKNGNFILDIQANPEFGLPYGADAQVPIWVATRYQLQKNTAPDPRIITFNTGSEFLRAFDLPLDGRTYQRTQERFLRIFGATMYFGLKKDIEHPGRVALMRAHWFDKIDLWFTRDLETQALPSEHFQNRIVLSESFAKDLDKHPIPIDLRVSAALSDAPAAQWFYHWIVWRSYNQPPGRIAQIPLFGEDGLISQMGIDGYEGAEGTRNFRKKIRHWLHVVGCLWPYLPAALDAEGDHLFVEAGQAILSGGRSQLRP